jgi:hypothetical protein
MIQIFDDLNNLFAVAIVAGNQIAGRTGFGAARVVVDGDYGRDWWLRGEMLVRRGRCCRILSAIGGWLCCPLPANAVRGCLGE